MQVHNCESCINKGSLIIAVGGEGVFPSKTYEIKGVNKGEIYCATEISACCPYCNEIVESHSNMLEISGAITNLELQSVLNKLSTITNDLSCISDMSYSTYIDEAWGYDEEDDDFDDDFDDIDEDDLDILDDDIDDIDDYEPDEDDDLYEPSLIDYVLDAEESLEEDWGIDDFEYEDSEFTDDFEDYESLGEFDTLGYDEDEVYCGGYLSYEEYENSPRHIDSMALLDSFADSDKVSMFKQLYNLVTNEGSLEEAYILDTFIYNMKEAT